MTLHTFTRCSLNRAISHLQQAHRREQELTFGIRKRKAVMQCGLPPKILGVDVPSHPQTHLRNPLVPVLSSHDQQRVAKFIAHVRRDAAAVECRLYFFMSVVTHFGKEDAEFVAAYLCHHIRGALLSLCLLVCAHVLESRVDAHTKTHEQRHVHRQRQRQRQRHTN